jgi:hypothetical protein
MSAPSSYRKPGQILDDLPALKRLSDQAAGLAKQQSQIAQLLPPALAKACRIGMQKGNTLVIVAANGAVAAKLRQLTPSLLLELQKREAQVSGITVEVQPPDLASFSIDKPPRRLAPKARSSLEELAGALEDSPLKQALKHLLKCSN